MEDKFYWKTVLSLAVLTAIIFGLLVSSVGVINNIENDKDVWFHRDMKWNTCSCSTEISEYVGLCWQFMEDCKEDQEIEIRGD